MILNIHFFTFLVITPGTQLFIIQGLLNPFEKMTEIIFYYQS